MLSVKYIFPNHVETNWIAYCAKKYSIQSSDSAGSFRRKIILDSIKDAYSRIGKNLMNYFYRPLVHYPIYFQVEPLFERRIKSKLKETAHHAAIDVFARNLKSLLLSPPLPNTNVLGLDPGNIS